VKRGSIVLAVALALSPICANTQPLSVAVVGDGWEAFRGIEYQGGDVGLTKKKLGAIVITDSSVAFHECENGGCYPTKGKPPFKGPPLLYIALRGITSVNSSSQVKDVGGFGKALMGNLAGDTEQEAVVISYETATSAEAPFFKTQKAQSAAVVAKINFRRRKLTVKGDSGR